MICGGEGVDIFKKSAEPYYLYVSGHTWTPVVEVCATGVQVKNDRMMSGKMRAGGAFFLF